MTTNIDIEQLSEFVRREVSLVAAGLTAQNWGEGTTSSWATTGFVKVFAFCAQDDEGLEFRKQAVSHERRQLIAKCQCYDRFSTEEPLDNLRAFIRLPAFVDRCQASAQLFADQQQKALAAVADMAAPKIKLKY